MAERLSCKQNVMSSTLLEGIDMFIEWLFFMYSYVRSLYSFFYYVSEVSSILISWTTLTKGTLCFMRVPFCKECIVNSRLFCDMKRDLLRSVFLFIEDLTLTYI